MSVFYERFARHDHGAGLKARSTHYCPGCGHGIVHRLLADAIARLGIQDRTIAISPVGCSVFLHYYLDVGNSQAAHGRAPAVALGHKLANPESIVISYQGDGDLASIGLAEILQAAQLGLPLTVIFVNNAIYGMTGGQMAPTTLLGQRTTTSPTGRTALMGRPLRMAELIAGLDGPIYVERVALFDARRRVKAAAAIEKAVRLQVEGKGFAFVEVLAECPTYLHLDPREAERFVEEQMLPVFPLGVKKDVPGAGWGAIAAPAFDPPRVASAIGGTPEAPPRFASGCARASELGLKLAGAGGDGAQTAAMLLVHAAIHEGLDATHIPSYGPESRGGTSYADVRIAEREVLSPTAPSPDVLVAFNAPSLAKFGPTVAPGGLVIYDSSTLASPPPLDPSVRVLGVPCSAIAQDLGQARVKNLVALGALAGATQLLPQATFLAAIREGLGEQVLALNEQAFASGLAAVPPRA